MGRGLRYLAGLWLTFCGAFFLGIYVYSAQIWPYSVILSVERFVSGDDAESTTVVEKLMNDFNFKPTRHIVKNETEYAQREYLELQGLPIDEKKRATPLIYLSATATPGYRVLYGVFDFDKSIHGIILLDEKGTVGHVWSIRQDDVAWKHQPDANVYPHGFEIARDGSVVVAYDAGTSLTKYDWCGNVVWRTPGRFHHSVAFDGKGSLWTWGNADVEGTNDEHLLKIDYETGEILDDFDLFQLYYANMEIDIMGILQADTHEKSKWLADIPGDMWHGNDIEPLTPELSVHYPQFSEGDLLVSLRSPNLIFVMDPDNRHIKWWRQGLVRRQHDPDWNDSGTITIFNNNMHKGYSSIVALDPLTYQSKQVVKGKAYGFYTWIRGKHQQVPGGGYLITSTEQGRVFEVDARGEVTFEFINKYGEDNAFLAVSEARFLPLDYFEESKQCSD